MGNSCDGHVITHVELEWHKAGPGAIEYLALSHCECGQLAILGTHEAGPFETRLETAQWAWKVLAKVVPPATG